MIEKLIKLNKYQKGMIISLLIFFTSMIGFMFNSRVRVSNTQDKVPDIVIDEPDNINDTDPDIKYSEVYFYVMMIIFPYLGYKIFKEIWNI